MVGKLRWFVGMKEKVIGELLKIWCQWYVLVLVRIMICQTI